MVVLFIMKKTRTPYCHTKHGLTNSFMKISLEEQKGLTSVRDRNQPFLVIQRNH